MRILITAVTGDLGRAVAGQLVAAGHQVSGIAARPHRDLDAGVELTCAPLDGPVLQDLADAADVILHLAPIEPDVPDSGGIGGVVRVAHAAGQAGARLLFPSQAAGDAELYGQAEELVSSSWAPSLVIRMAPPVGRQVDWMICRSATTLLTVAGAKPVRVLHVDDLHRFLLRAVSSAETGVVDLAGADVVTLFTARRLLSAAGPRPRRIPVWPNGNATAKLNPLPPGWGFEYGWGAADAVADTARGLVGRRLGVARAIDVPGRLPMPVSVLARPDNGRPDNAGPNTALRDAAPAGVGGEFDTPISPVFPVFSTRCASDALPGPLTPMTLDVHGVALRTAQRATAQLLGLPSPLADEWECRATAVLGHRMFTGVSAAVDVAATLPGASADVVRRLLLGADADDGLCIPTRHRRSLLPSTDPAVTGRILALARRYRAECADYAATATSEHRDAAVCGRLTEAQLDVRIRLARDRIAQGWVLTSLGMAVEGLLSRVAARDHPGISVPSSATSTKHLASEVSALAGFIRSDAELHRLTAMADLDAIRMSYPQFADTFDDAIARVGHRGTGEAELANPVIADSPTVLLAAAALAAREVATAAPQQPRPKLTHRLADDATTAREQSWDTTLRYLHQLRITLREFGIRLTARKVLTAGDDIFYLTPAEALAPPADAKLRVDRRRAERERLQSISVPDVVDGTWSPLESHEPATDDGAIIEQALSTTDLTLIPDLAPQAPG